MDAIRRLRVMGFFGKTDNVINVFLGGALLALGFRSTSQQREIEALEAEKSSLRRANKAMSTAMWEWRQQLFPLVDSTDPVVPLSKNRLRAIFGEYDPTTTSSLPLPQGLQEEESIPIA